MIRDDKKVLQLQKQQPVKPTIYLYTSAGKLMEQLQVIFAFIFLFLNYLIHKIMLSLLRSGIKVEL